MTIAEKVALLADVKDALADYAGDMNKAIDAATAGLTDPNVNWPAIQTQLVDSSVGINHLTQYTALYFPLLTGDVNWTEVPEGY